MYTNLPQNSMPIGLFPIYLFYKSKFNKEEGFEVDFQANKNVTIHPMILKVLKGDPEDDSAESQNT